MPWHVGTAWSYAASGPFRSSTGEQVDVGEKYVPQFKAGKEIRERINR